MVRARYTSSKFCSGQLRVVCDNAYRTEGAASLSPGSISELQFWELIEPAFHNEVRGAHVGAVFKRSVIILNTKEHLVVKLAGQPTATVYALPPDASYISPESPGLLKSYYEDNILRDDFEMLVKEEGVWMNELMTKRRSCLCLLHPLQVLHPGMKDNDPAAGEGLHRRARGFAISHWLPGAQEVADPRTEAEARRGGCRGVCF